MINRQVAYAFKVFNSNRLVRESIEANKIFLTIIAEIRVLGHRSIRDHPNIVTLEGICWDVDSEIEIVWPVLVFKKSNHGDLQTFIQDSRVELNLDSKFALCINIASAIAAMHSVSIIHGDIKPENVLIFRSDSDDYYVAKMTDFGYSSWYANADKLVYMPRTLQWTAPEWHHRAFSIADALRMDVFSFGLLCLWILFYNCQKDIHAGFENSIKPEERNLSFAQKSIVKLGELNDQEKSRLNRFFELTLAIDPQERSLDVWQLTKLLMPHFASALDISKLTEDREAPPQETFQLDLLYEQLYPADFRVRPYIAACLEKRLINSASSHEAQNAAFQLALCYKIGFGVPLDDNKSQSLLRQSTMRPEDIESRLSLMRKSGMYMYLRTHSFADLVESEGSFFSINVAQAYRNQGQLDRAELEIKREIRDAENILGAESYVTTSLKSSLMMILGLKENWEELEQLALQRLEQEARAQSGENPGSLDIMANLAKAYIGQERFEEAEELLNKIMRTRERILGEEHPSTLISMSNLAVLYARQGKCNEAEQLNSQALKKLRRVLGEKALTTCESMEVMAYIYSLQGKWRKAGETELKVLTIREGSLGQEHPDTLRSIQSLARYYGKEGKRREAEELHMRWMEIKKGIFGGEYPDTLAEMEDVITAYNLQGNFSEAAKLAMRRVEIQQKQLGEEHLSTLSGMHDLAFYFCNEQKWQEAEKLNVHVLDTRKRLLGEDHPDTLISMIHLVVTYMGQNRMEEFVQLLSEAIRLSIAVLGPENPYTLGRINLLDKWTGESWSDRDGLLSAVTASLGI
ncbi:MAG: hypothetical protein Q9187_004112 [Circinaria calcarea]